MEFQKASELKKHIGEMLEWTYAHDHHRGTCLVRKGRLENVQGRNLLISGDYFYFSDIKANLRIVPKYRTDSQFCQTAIRALHRAEIDAFAEVNTALNKEPAQNWPNASRHAGKRDSGKVFQKLWSWANNRWVQKFPSEEYKLREENRKSTNTTTTEDETRKPTNQNRN